MWDNHESTFLLSDTENMTTNVKNEDTLGINLRKKAAENDEARKDKAAANDEARKVKAAANDEARKDKAAADDE